MNKRTVYTSIAIFFVLTVLSVFYVFKLQFSFSIDQFFPEGDEDLAFYQEFIEEFEADINFLLVAAEKKSGVFEQEFLEDFQSFTNELNQIPKVANSQSLTKISYPLKTPFGITAIPAIHVDQPERYENDKEKILADTRFVNTLIDENATAMVVALKTDSILNLEESEQLIPAIEKLASKYSFDDYHILGPPYFQKEVVEMQKREITISAIVSGILVSLIMFLIFRRPWGITIALFSIGLGLLLFFGMLGGLGWELNAMAALYPVLMIIVGTSDVIHIMTKYIDEVRGGKTRKEAIIITIKEIGLATLLTSLTTAIGFASLMTSRVAPIRDFGVNAALGVIVAYVTVIGFTCAVLTLFPADKLIKLGNGPSFWDRLMQRAYDYSLNNTKIIAWSTLGVFLVSLWGLSMINTNYTVEGNLPRGEKITEDFKFFERTFAGFRPIEMAVYAQGNYQADDFEVVKAVAKVEEKMQSINDIKSVNSLATFYKSINQMYNNNRRDAFEMPDDERTFKKYQKLAQKIPDNTTSIIISKDRKKTRITSRILDIGADSIKATSKHLDNWIAANTDSSIVKIKQTGMGLILDKNSEYVRRDLIYGLGLAILVISIIMALLFRNLKMVLISLVPNIFPLLLAGAMLGFLGIDLEAGVAIVFAVVFGIAVDDTIHFLSKFKLARNKGKTIEEALHVTFMETGKAICLTSIILFFGFLVMLFSIHPPSVTIGLLISLTLASAILADLFTIPLLIRWMIKDKKN